MLTFGTGLNSTLKDQIMSHPALHDALNDPNNGDSATKHLKQQVCVGHADPEHGSGLSAANILFLLNVATNELSLSVPLRDRTLPLQKPCVNVY